MFFIGASKKIVWQREEILFQKKAVEKRMVGLKQIGVGTEPSRDKKIRNCNAILIERMFLEWEACAEAHHETPLNQI